MTTTASSNDRAENPEAGGGASSLPYSMSGGLEPPQATAISDLAQRHDIYKALASAEENERRRISRDLHDQVGQQTAALGLGLRAVKAAVSDRPELCARLDDLEALAVSIGHEIHRKALELRPTALDDLGLAAALGNLLDEWSRYSGVIVDHHMTSLEGVRLPPHVESTLYRIVQEALTNVARHAKATHLGIVLEKQADAVVVIVEDDGQGFDAALALEATGPKMRIGLVGMKERIALAGGRFDVESSPGKGSTLFVRIPI